MDRSKLQEQSQKEGANIFRKITYKHLIYGFIILAAAVLIFFVAWIFVKQGNEIKTARATAVSHIDLSLHGKDAQAYLYPISKTSSTKQPATTCGSDAGKDIVIGNYRVLVVTNWFAGLHKTYSYNLGNLTITPGQDKLWNGDLRKTDTGEFTLYQYQSCTQTRAFNFDINPNTDKLELSQSIVPVK
ncbi:hypothetical protein KGQ24_02150 [Patescibacteria group bacterium]|nr:hypothetical protein [Patescibacteria group bacterium]